MTVFVGVFADDIEQPVIYVIMEEVDFASESARRDAVDGEDVAINATEIWIIRTLNQCGPVVLYLSEGEGIIAVGFRTFEFQMGGEVFLGMLDEPFIIRSGHGDVYVIIPRDESAVAYRSEHGAIRQIIGEPVFLKCFVNIRQ